MDTKSKLPSAQQERRDRMISLEGTGEVSTPPSSSNSEDSNVPATDLPPADVTIETGVVKPDAQEHTPPEVTREYIERAEAAERRMQLMQLELAEAQARNQGLTAAPEASKSSGTGSVVTEALAPQIELGDSEETPDETERFGEAGPYVDKRINKRMKDVNKALQDLHARLQAVESESRTANTIASKSSSDMFVDKVRSSVPKFDEIIRAKSWIDFGEKTVPMTGMTYKQAVDAAHANRRLADMVDIFKTYKATLGIKDAPGATTQSTDADAGYTAIPTTNTGTQGNPPAQSRKLPISERKTASEDFLKGRITRAEMDVIAAKYKDAELKGNIDYDN